MSARSRVFVVRFGALGDVVLTTPLLRALYEAHPDLPITFVTKQAYAPLMETHPAVSEVVALEPADSLLGFSRRLGIRSHDIVLDLHASLRSHLVRILCRGRWSAYEKNRKTRRRRIRGQTAPPDQPVAERYFTAARSLSIAPDGKPAELFTTPADESAARAMTAPGSIILVPGASRWTKRWPAERWQILARDLVAHGWRVTGLGTAAERPLLAGAPVADGFGMPLRTAVAACRQASVVVANDSGIMHVAAAVGTPVVVIFGPTSAEAGFAPYQARATIVQRSLPCRPCSSYGTTTCPQGHHRCMTEIAPADVLGAIEQAA